MNAPRQQSFLSLVCILALTGALSLCVAGQTNGSPAWTAAAPATIQPGTASAVPRLINFNGLIKNADGKPQVGEIKLTFSLYEGAEGGAPLWSETQSVTTDDQGRYTVVLGSTLTDGLPRDLFTSGQPRWLGVLPDLDGMSEQPRVLLVSIPYALKAADAETLGGKPASAFVLSPTTSSSGTAIPSGSAVTTSSSPSRTGGIKTDVDGSGSTGYLPIWTGPTTLGNSTIWQGISSLKVGIGTTTPLTKLSVLANGLNINLGDYGCNSGYGGIGFGSTIDCNHYSVLGDGTSTYFNRPTGGTMYFREGNTTQMRILPGGNVGIGVSIPQASLSVNGSSSNIRIGNFGCGAGIGFGTGTPNCTAYSYNSYNLLSDSTNSYLNAPGDNFTSLHIQVSNKDILTLEDEYGTVHLNDYGLDFDNLVRVDGPVQVLGHLLNENSDASSGPTATFTNDFGFALVAGGVSTSKQCVIDQVGDLICTGLKSAAVPVDSGQRKVALYAVESPENWFEDFGSAQLTNGVAQVKLEPTFAQTINSGIEYHVFVTPKGDCKGLFVSQETPSSFEVRELGSGKSNVAFDFRIVARRLGYEDVRMADKTEMFRQNAEFIASQERQIKQRKHREPARSGAAVQAHN